MLREADQEIEHARVFRKPGYVEGKVFPSFDTLVWESERNVSWRFTIFFVL